MEKIVVTSVVLNQIGKRKMLLINGKEISNIDNIQLSRNASGDLIISFSYKPDYFSAEASCSEEQKQ